MSEIRLLGELGRKFGQKFNLDVKTPAEAVRALSVNLPGFEQHLVQSHQRNVVYKVSIGKEVIGEKDLHNPSGKRVIKFTPVIAGAGGRGVFQTIVGIALIVASFYIPGGWAIAGTTIKSMVFSVGVSLTLGGVMQMLTPLPSTPKLEDRPENKPSFVFNGPINTTAQGYPVPVGFGRMIVGSAVISAGISTEDLPI
jgi:predicted phage tail protein